jgi:hypothetical protein
MRSAETSEAKPDLFSHFGANLTGDGIDIPSHTSDDPHRRHLVAQSIHNLPTHGISAIPASWAISSHSVRSQHHPGLFAAPLLH